jgi:carboxypeptidase C (cathepsin A)
VKTLARATAVALLFTAAAIPVLAASGSQQSKSTPAESSQPAHESSQPPQAKSSITHGSVSVEGQRIPYTAKTGILILKNNEEKPIASMSYVAYFRSDAKDAASRPITFFYNGGPGSSTIWLHMLAFGPQLVKVGNGTLTPPAPYQMVNNDYSLLDATDEVFVDAPGTGFGRVIGKDEGGAGKPDDVFGIDPDAHAFADFITQFLTENNRWTSPKFLFGESYGTTRSAVLSHILETEDSVGLNGVILLSSILNFNINVDFPQIDPGVSLSYALGLPTYTATAWYHHKLPQATQGQDLHALLARVEQFATHDYLLALNQGDQIDAATKRQVAEQMSQYTGLPVDYIMKADLKVTGGQFAHELLGGSDMITGRLDSRYSGPVMNPLGETATYDPLDSAIDAATVARFNDYVRSALDFGKDMTYKPQIEVFREWGWKHQQPGVPMQLPFTPNVMPDLAATMKFDPNVKVLLTGGYFDLGTPFYSAEYEMHQLGLPPKLQNNISYDFFPSGHMVYVNPEAHKALHDTVAKFIESSYKAQ